MNVVIAAADPDRADALERAAARAGHRVSRLPASFAKAIELLDGADALLADLAQDPADAAWTIAYALARGRLVIASARAHEPIPLLVRDNPSPYQRIVVGEPRDLEHAIRELLTT